MRVLVCGGRTFNNAACVNDWLTWAHELFGISLVITGGANGADRLGENWAYNNNICFVTFEADWDNHGKAAGPIRNQRMLDEGKPDLVIAFPGGKGTAHMVSIAKKVRGINVFEIGENDGD